MSFIKVFRRSGVENHEFYLEVGVENHGFFQDFQEVWSRKPWVLSRLSGRLE